MVAFVNFLINERWWWGLTRLIISRCNDGLQREGAVASFTPALRRWYPITGSQNNICTAHALCNFRLSVHSLHIAATDVARLSENKTSKKFTALSTIPAS